MQWDFLKKVVTLSLKNRWCLVKGHGIDRMCHKLWINQFYICQKTLPVLEMNIVGGARQCHQGNLANRCTCPQEQCTCTKKFANFFNGSIHHLLFFYLRILFLTLMYSQIRQNWIERLRWASEKSGYAILVHVRRTLFCKVKTRIKTFWI